MIEQSTISTQGMRAARQASLVRDTAFNLFNLEVDFGHEPSSVSADIRIARSPLGGPFRFTTIADRAGRTAFSALSRAAL